MAKITWLGEPDANGDGPRTNDWNGKTFVRGEAVEITDPQMIEKARANPFYSVDGGEPGEAADHAGPVRNQEPAGPVVKDQTELGSMTKSELRDLAAERGVDVEGMTKAEIVDALMNAPANVAEE